MSIAELKAQMDGLSLDERRHLAAYLVSLRHRELQQYRESLTAKIDNQSPENWVSFEEFDQRVSV
jgi:hypothetical protein